MNKKQKSLSRWLTYEELKAKEEYTILFNRYFNPHDESWVYRIPPDVMKKMQELYIKAGDAFPKKK